METIFKICTSLFVFSIIGFVVSLIYIIINKESKKAKYAVLSFGITIVVLLIIGAIGIVDAISNCGTSIGAH